MENSVSTADRHKLHELCKTQLGGQWAEVSADQLIIRTSTGGFVNQLFYCDLPEHMKTKYNRVAVRYQDGTAEMAFFKYCKPIHILTMGLVLSERQLAPKLLSVFDKGQISEYIDGVYFTGDYDLNPGAVALLAQKLAKFQSMDMPVPKDRTEFTLKMILEDWFDETHVDSYRQGVVYQEIRKNNYQTLMDTDLIAEIAWVRKAVVDVNSPIVFSHNDFNRRNILVRKTGGNPIGDSDIFIIDFDFSCYMYRGSDFGDYFINYCQEELDFGGLPFPTDTQMSPFI
ncbi:unnamed protein product, partial [Oppiella nova]